MELVLDTPGFQLKNLEVKVTYLEAGRSSLSVVSLAYFLDAH